MRKCLQCGRFLKKKLKKYCSKKCYTFGRIKKIKVECISCHKIFYKHPHWYNQSKNHYCSNFCATRIPWNKNKNLSFKHRKKLSEGHLGKEISMEHRNKISNALKGHPSWSKGYKHSHKFKMKMRKLMLENNPFKGKHHTQKTKLKLSLDRLGGKHHHWKGGISKYPYPFEYDERFKLKIAKRDKHICQYCGKRILRKIKKVVTGVTHHINYNKNDLNPRNHIWVCRQPCNSILNFDRDYNFALICYHQGIEPEELVV